MEVDLDAIGHNVRQLRAAVPPGGQLMAVVKADGYGHGALPVAREALAQGAGWLGVAIAEEAIALRAGLRAGLRAAQTPGEPPILVMGHVPPPLAPLLVRDGIAVACYQLELAQALSAAARDSGREAAVHIKVDTGMGRIGVSPEEALEFARAVAALPGVRVEGVFTHFAAADEPDPAYTASQARRFAAVREAFRGAGIDVPVWHASNSAGLIVHPGEALSLVRAGIALYGIYPSAHAEATARAGGGPRLRPALQWKARLSHVKRVARGAAISYGCTYRAPRDMWVGTVPAGYADGFARRWSNRGRVLLRGREVPVIGRVCMDQFMVDVDAFAADPARVGEEVVLIGRQGGAAIPAEAFAAGLDTIAYEVVCAIGRRVPRVYLRGGAPVEMSPPCPQVNIMC